MTAHRSGVAGLLRARASEYRVALAGVFAPVPDFRYVGLEPVPARQLRAFGAALALGASVTLAASSLDPRHAVVAGGIASVVAALGLRSASGPKLPARGSVRMGIVPWGVLVHTDDAPRILRWAAVKRIDIATSRIRGLWSPGVASRVAVETERERFVGAAIGAVPLDRLVAHLDAYADEQATPVALDLDGEHAAEVLEPECETLVVAARVWLETRAAAVRLDLPPGGYRRIASPSASPRAVDVLRRILKDRTPKPADPRAFAAVLAAELHAAELVPDLVALTQCPHPIVAAVAKQAAHKLGAARARIGTLEEVAPFLFDGDRARLDAWARDPSG